MAALAAVAAAVASRSVNAVLLAVSTLRWARERLLFERVMPVPPCGLRSRAFLLVMFDDFEQARSLPEPPDDRSGTTGLQRCGRMTSFSRVKSKGTLPITPTAQANGVHHSWSDLAHSPGAINQPGPQAS